MIESCLAKSQGFFVLQTPVSQKFLEESLGCMKSQRCSFFCASSLITFPHKPPAWIFWNESNPTSGTESIRRSPNDKVTKWYGLLCNDSTIVTQ
jgi:hypothetical protein